MTARGPRLVALPLAVWERDGLAAALVKAGLPAGDVNDPGHLFWRFHENDVPVGFGGLEVHGDVALLRSVVTLPPLRMRGYGRAIVSALELEIPRHCEAVYLLTKNPGFFQRLGYSEVRASEVPISIQATQQFAALAGAATVMRKPVG
jgi:N-acetylglutamate synthase-like GNAT family acetyltransferase